MYAIIDSFQTNKKGEEFVRVDFYLDEGDPLFNSYYIDQPKRELTSDELDKSLKGEKSFTKEQLNKYITDNIGWEKVNTPFNCHFFRKPVSLEDLDDKVKERIILLKKNITENAKSSNVFTPMEEVKPLTECRNKYIEGTTLEIGVEISDK